MLESQNILCWKKPTKVHRVQLPVSARPRPFQSGLLSRHFESTWSDTQERTRNSTATTHATSATIPGPVGKGAGAQPARQSHRAARQTASLAPALNESRWQEGDDTEQQYKTTFILSHLRPAVVNKHVTTDEATGNRAGCFHWCITLRHGCVFLSHKTLSSSMVVQGGHCSHSSAAIRGSKEKCQAFCWVCGALGGQVSTTKLQQASAA